MSDNLKESLQKLNKYTTRKEKYIILFTDLPNDKVTGLLLRIYNGKCLWMTQILQEQIDSMQIESDIKGKYSQFIDMIYQSLENYEFQLDLVGQNLTITFTFNLTKGVFVKSQIKLGGGLQIEDEDSIEAQSTFTFDLFEALKNQYTQMKYAKEAEIRLLQQSTLVSKDKSIKDQSVPLSEIKEEPIVQKKKLNADIFMPNKKKRKVIGVQLQ